MNNSELDSWFCSLSVKQIEHIACRVLKKQGKDPKEGVYPHCATIWNALDESKKQYIHDHCTDQHGMWIQEGGDAPFYSY